MRSKLELTPAQWELVAEHRAFVDRAAARAARRWPAADPVALEEWALEGLMYAARQFDPTRGAKFTTYAMLRISGAMTDGHRRQYGRNGERLRVLVPLEEEHKARQLVAEPAVDEGPSYVDVPWIVVVWLWWDRRFPCKQCGAQLSGRQRDYCSKVCARRFDAGSSKQGPTRSWERRPPGYVRTRVREPADA